MSDLDIPDGYSLAKSECHDGYNLVITHNITHDIAYHCAVHYIIDTRVVHCLAVRSFAHLHSEAVRNLKRHILIDYILQQHQAVLMSAGNVSTGSRFSFQTQIEHAISRGIHAYGLDDDQIVALDRQALQHVFDMPWDKSLPLVLLSKQELPKDAEFSIPSDVIERLDSIDARAVIAL